MAEYSHRNQSPAAPATDDWYWFEGDFMNSWNSEIAFSTNGPEIVQLEDGLFFANGENAGFKPEQMRGLFWGPVPRPDRGHDDG